MKKEINNKDYVDISEYENDRYPFQFFIGGRGTGKTYSGQGLAIMCAHDQERRMEDMEIFRETFPKSRYKGEGEREGFIWMRRTEKELKAITDSKAMGEGGNTFKTIDQDFGWNYGICHMTESISGIYEREYTKEGNLKPVGMPIGYALALNTVAGVRGVDFSDCSRLFYDEFIAERHVRRMAHEGEAFLNAIESIGRNRELQGKPALKVYCFANSYNIYTPIFEVLGLVSKVERMIAKGQRDLYLETRGCAIHLLEPSSEFIKAKSNTSLYKLTGGTEFADMALKNDFVYNDFSNIGYRKLAGYVPICSCENMYIYNKKGSGEFYCCYSPARVAHYKTNTAVDKKAWQRRFRQDMTSPMLRHDIYFETYELKEKFLDLMDIRRV